jgi:Fe2+ or Zn2+ uptake regulation protein
LRSSKQRDLVCEIVNLCCANPTAEEIYEMSRQQIPNISLGTVYRNLNT